MKNNEIIVCRYINKDGRVVRSTRHADILLRMLVSLYVPSRLILGIDIDSIEIFRWDDLPGDAWHEKVSRIPTCAENRYRHVGERIHLPEFPEELESCWAENAIPFTALIEPLDFALCAQNFDIDTMIGLEDDELLVRLFNQISVPPKSSPGATLTRDEVRMLLLLMYENAYREATSLIFSSLKEEFDSPRPRAFIRKSLELSEEVSQVKTLDTASFFFMLDPGLDFLPWHPENDEDDEDDDLPY